MERNDEEFDLKVRVVAWALWEIRVMLAAGPNSLPSRVEQACRLAYGLHNEALSLFAKTTLTGIMTTSFDTSRRSMTSTERCCFRGWSGPWEMVGSDELLLANLPAIRGAGAG